jgi:hypothetical protein
MSLLDALLEESLLDSVVTHEVWIAIRTDGPSGDGPFGAGTQNDPYDGSTQAKFDKLMREVVPSQATIRLGPGIFQTKGGAGHNTPGAWLPQGGQKIVGSGMFATTLQFVGARTDTEHVYSYSLIGSFDWLDGFEVSDLTLDCNLDGQPNTTGYRFPRTMVLAIDVRGVRIKFVKPGPFSPMPVAALTHLGTTATLRTPWPHNLTTTDKLIVSGASPSAYNGKFSISAIIDARTLQYTMLTDPGADATGNITAEKVSKPSLLVKSLVPSTGMGNPSNRVILQKTTANNREPGQRFVVIEHLARGFQRN